MSNLGDLNVDEDQLLLAFVLLRSVCPQTLRLLESRFCCTFGHSATEAKVPEHPLGATLPSFLCLLTLAHYQAGCGIPANSLTYVVSAIRYESLHSFVLVKTPASALSMLRGAPGQAYTPIHI